MFIKIINEKRLRSPQISYRGRQAHRAGLVRQDERQQTAARHGVCVRATVPVRLLSSLHVQSTSSSRSTPRRRQ